MTRANAKVLPLPTKMQRATLEQARACFARLTPPPVSAEIVKRMVLQTNLDPDWRDDFINLVAWMREYESLLGELPFSQLTATSRSGAGEAGGC